MHAKAWALVAQARGTHDGAMQEERAHALSSVHRQERMSSACVRFSVSLVVRVLAWLALCGGRVALALLLLPRTTDIKQLPPVTRPSCMDVCGCMHAGRGHHCTVRRAEVVPESALPQDRRCTKAAAV